MTETQPRGRNVLGRPRRDAQVDLMVGAMVRGATVPEASRAAGVAVSTGYELLKEPAVADRLAQARGDALAEASRHAAAQASTAVGVLASLLESRSETVRLRAADVLLSHAAAMARDAEAEAQVRELAAQIEALSIAGEA